MKKKKSKKKRSARKETPKKPVPKKTPKKKKPIEVEVVKRRHATEEELKYLGKEKRLARREYVADKQKTAELLKAAVEKMKRYIKILKDIKDIWDDLMTLIRFVRAWVAGKYRRAPLRTILGAVAAIIYFVEPFDVIADFIPWVGYVDDGAVIAFVINSIRDDLDDFLEWERTKK